MVSRGVSRALWALIGAGVVLGVACGERREAAAALEAAAPYLDRFDRFDAWARRALAAGPAMRSQAVLEETLFAPIRLDRDVVDAWVVRARIAPRRWSLRGLELPGEASGWASVRHPIDGPLEVLETALRDPNGEDRRALLVARRAPGAVGAEVEVVVAFLIGAGGGS